MSDEGLLAQEELTDLLVVGDEWLLVLQLVVCDASYLGDDGWQLVARIAEEL